MVLGKRPEEDKPDKDKLSEREHMPDATGYIIGLSNKLDKPFITISNYKIPRDVIGLIPENICRNYQLVPISRIGQVVTVSMADPLNILTLDNLAIILKDFEIHPVISSLPEIINAIDLYYSLRGEITEADKDLIKEIKIESVVKKEEFNVLKIAELSKDETIVNTSQAILAEALKSKASDIHIEPYENELRVRYRIDGILHKINSYAKTVQDALIARFKIMSSLDITQRRLPQDGRFGFTFQHRDIDCRLSILPVNFGEKVVIRILDKGNLKFELSGLGFAENVLNTFQKAIVAPFGAILITGPTGSGKSTTLYAILNQLNSIQKSIVTIEDPIEYHLRGITQIQIKPDINLGFAASLRAVLRQNPDLIMVGEIRDMETADIAMKAALTGHLVLSTLHTNDAPSAVTRLVDMGVEPFLISSSVVMVVAQRLCRCLCPHCRKEYEMGAEDLRKFLIKTSAAKVTLYQPGGCEHCGNSGYLGRTLVAEAFTVDDEIRQMILDRTPDTEIRQHVTSQGMKSLREDGFQKVLKGITSLEEVIRVTAEF